MKFTRSHEWILLDNNEALIGLSQFGKEELGEIVWIQLPEVGKHYKKEEQIVTLESTKAAIDLYTPLDGEVVAINDHFLAHPEEINSCSEEQRWFYRLRVEAKIEQEGWMDEKSYRTRFR